MADPAASYDNGSPFEVSDAPETATPQPEFEGMNVCRAAALSMMFSIDREEVRDVAPELQELGFSEGFRTGQYMWPQVHPLEQFPDLREQRYSLEDRNRINLWQELNRNPRPQSATAFLVAVLGSSLERESTAAASALWRQTSRLNQLPVDRRRLFESWHDLLHMWDPSQGPPWEMPWGHTAWPGTGPYDLDPEEYGPQDVPRDPDQWTQLYERALRTADQYAAPLIVNWLARWRLDLAMRSPDPITRSLSLTALLPTERPDEGTVTIPHHSSSKGSEQEETSTMIHGTWGWEGDWWFPGFGFHKFMLPHRPNLYSRKGTPFSWSGRYRANSREKAANRFLSWAKDEAPQGLQTVFAHSYGGEVAARAALLGTPVRELVLLSVPVTSHVIDAVAIPNLRVVDVRLRFDPVLALTSGKQKIPPPAHNVTPVVLNWRLDHGATHRPTVWEDQGLIAECWP